MIKAFPKIFAIGTDYIRDIFNEEVEITEKVDGSQWVFGKIDGQVYMRSKGKAQYDGAVDKMFQPAADYVSSLDLPENTIFYCEYLRQPKHNTLAYDRAPKNHLTLFGVCDETDRFISLHEMLTTYADELGIDVVPLLGRGCIGSAAELKALLNQESYLGGQKIEGVVVKNYERQFLLGGQPMPLMAGKFVSEQFKETNQRGWAKAHTGKGKWQTFCESFKTEARWHKAIQHLRDNGELQNAPQDIGPLLKEIQRDILEEEGEAIKEVLWKQFGREVTSAATRGFPEWYKEQLLERSFDGGQQ